MIISINDFLPEVSFFFMSESGPKKIGTKELFDNKKIILVGVSGAFTPTCSLEHLPGFIQKKDNFFSKGIEKIIFMSVNDPFVISEWSKSHNEDDIFFIGDSSGEFASKTGLKMDLSVIGLGTRLSRFAMLVDNGQVKLIFDEEGGDLKKSTASIVLDSI
tara:strand:- start:243 stop:722 length:480 start_codon:yes stop_codon:yes gene_type:complete